MSLQIAFKQKMEVGSLLREYAEEQTKKLEEHFGLDFSVTWSFENDHLFRVTHCHLLGKNMNYFAESSRANFISSIDEILHELKKQLKRNRDLKRKRVTHAAY